MTDFKKIQDLLEELHDEGDHIPERSSIHHQWVEKHFALLQDMIEKQRHPLKKITEKLKAEITLSPQTLQKHYQAVKKLKLAEARRAKKNQTTEAATSAAVCDRRGGSTKQSRARVKPPEVDLSKISPPPQLVHAEIVED
ncbi:hypothetical protein C1752_10457 [Acaryochloris thomasi RCC1774]|uniref:Uncharacterized protein n=1 Tax=Acaryochloris thomasi RCC1774 TaxID=1764569 RepID=A0A2W1JNY0_9CYAN|nr:hypothetical protein [Acaryochloris thomasi]PZD70607.1 hypothetical protein C1752_10457 [Acaryochloris thomasi RCC1774]